TGAAPGSLCRAAPGVAPAGSRRFPGGSPMNGQNAFVAVHNGQAIPRGTVADAPWDLFRRGLLEAVASGDRVAALFGGDPSTPDGNVDLYAVLADSGRAQLRVGRTRLDADRFPSLTPDCPQVHLFEREIAEQYGVCPEGHPWYKPVRFHASYRP